MTTTPLRPSPPASASFERQRFPRSPRARLVGGVAVVAVVLGTVGVRTIGESDAERVAAAGVRTTQEGTARVSMTSLLRTSQEAGQRSQAAGLIDFEAGRTAFRVRVGLPGQAEGSAPSSVALLTVTDGATTYLRSPNWPQGQPWVRYVEQGADGPVAGGSAGYDLGGQLELLLGAASAPQALGEEEIRNVPTRRWRTTVDLAAAAEAGDDEQAAALEQISALGDGRLPLELWVDELGRVRRLAYSLEMAGDEGTTTVDTQVEYYDFGVEADVAVPELTVDYSPPRAAAQAAEG